MIDLKEIQTNPHSRRDFLLRMTAAGLGVAALQLLAGCGGVGNQNLTGENSFDPTNFPGITGRNQDEVALNYGLTLELLRADLYRQAVNLASGRPATAALDTSLPAPGTTGAYTQTINNGAISSTLASNAYRTLIQNAYAAAARRDFLDAKLQSLGAPRAVANPLGYTAPFGNTLSSVLSQLYTLEERGSSAYLGSASYIKDPTLLTTTAALSSNSARNAASLAYYLGLDTNPTYSSGDLRVTDSGNAPYGSTTAPGAFSYYRYPTTILNDLQSYMVH